MKKIIIMSFLFMNVSLQADTVVVTFVNKAPVNIHAQFNFSDNSMQQKDIGVAQSYQVVNFDDKKLISAEFSSLDRDKNGNLYVQLHKKFKTFMQHEKYNIQLELVPSHQVAASPGTEAFMMPDSQKIVCKKA